MRDPEKTARTERVARIAENFINQFGVGAAAAAKSQADACSRSGDPDQARDLEDAYRELQRLLKNWAIMDR